MAGYPFLIDVGGCSVTGSTDVVPQSQFLFLNLRIMSKSLMRWLKKQPSFLRVNQDLFCVCDYCLKEEREEKAEIQVIAKVFGYRMSGGICDSCMKGQLKIIDKLSKVWEKDIILEK